MAPGIDPKLATLLGLAAVGCRLGPCLSPIDTSIYDTADGGEEEGEEASESRVVPDRMDRDATDALRAEAIRRLEGAGVLPPGASGLSRD